MYLAKNYFTRPFSIEWVNKVAKNPAAFLELQFLAVSDFRTTHQELDLMINGKKR